MKAKKQEQPSKITNFYYPGCSNDLKLFIDTTESHWKKDTSKDNEEKKSSNLRHTSFVGTETNDMPYGKMIDLLEWSKDFEESNRKEDPESESEMVSTVNIILPSMFKVRNKNSPSFLKTEVVLNCVYKHKPVDMKLKIKELVNYILITL